MEITTKHLQIILGIFILISFVLGGYIIVEKIDLCETVKNESYNIGSQQGVFFWNDFVVRTVTEQGEIPYIINNTIQSIPIKQIYEATQND